MGLQLFSYATIQLFWFLKFYQLKLNYLTIKLFNQDPSLHESLPKTLPKALPKTLPYQISTQDPTLPDLT